MSSFDLQKESDVKEYLEKLGIEYRFGCYSEKRPEVCHLLGDYLESIKKDFEKASKVYRSNCDDYGYARSCLKYGNYSFLGKGKSGTKGSPTEALKYYERGCDLKDADSCLHSGLMLVSKTMQATVERDVPRGIQFLTKACDMNNATACFYLSGLHISGVETKESPPPAAKHHGFSSSPGAAASATTSAATTTTTTTAAAAASAAVTPAKDFIVEKDMAKAFGFAYKACELKNMYACANLSQMYARGEGIAKNESNAEKYRKIALEMQGELKESHGQLTFQQGI